MEDEMENGYQTTSRYQDQDVANPIGPSKPRFDIDKAMAMSLDDFIGVADIRVPNEHRDRVRIIKEQNKAIETNSVPNSIYDDLPENMNNNNSLQVGSDDTDFALTSQQWRIQRLNLDSRREPGMPPLALVSKQMDKSELFPYPPTRIGDGTTKNKNDFRNLNGRQQNRNNRRKNRYRWNNTNKPYQQNITQRLGHGCNNRQPFKKQMNGNGISFCNTSGFNTGSGSGPSGAVSRFGNSLSTDASFFTGTSFGGSAGNRNESNTVPLMSIPMNRNQIFPNNTNPTNWFNCSTVSKPVNMGNMPVQPVPAPSINELINLMINSDQQTPMQFNVVSTVVSALLDKFDTTKKNGLKYDMDVQKEISTIQKKPLQYKCPGAGLISENGKGVTNVPINNDSTNLTLTHRFS